MNTPEYYLIKAFLAENKKRGFRLQSGLALAFTPAVENEGVNRLVASLKGRAVSDATADELSCALRAALRKRGVGLDFEFRLVPRRELHGENGRLHHMVVFEWRVVRVEL